MSYEIIVNPPAQYVIEYSNQRGPQGPAGADALDTIFFDTTNSEGEQKFAASLNNVGIATLEFTSTGIVDGPWQSVNLLCDAENGFAVGHGSNAIIIRTGKAEIRSGAIAFEINSTGYFVSDPANFRAAIGIAETFGEYLAVIAATTSDPGVINQPWNDAGTFKFSSGSLAVFLRQDGFSSILRSDGVSLFVRA